MATPEQKLELTEEQMRTMYSEVNALIREANTMAGRLSTLAQTLASASQPLIRAADSEELPTGLVQCPQCEHEVPEIALVAGPIKCASCGATVSRG